MGTGYGGGGGYATPYTLFQLNKRKILYYIFKRKKQTYIVKKT